MLGWQAFSWSAQWSPIFLACLIFAGLVYWLYTGKYRHRFSGSQPVSVKTRAFFISGLAVIYIAHGSPLDLMGHLMFSAHMTSMSLAYLIAPPLLWLGTPDWMIRPVIEKYFTGRAKFVFNPVFTLLLFNGLFSFYHLPVIHDYVMTNYAVHTLFYIALYIAALLMWWYMVSPLPDWNRLSDLKRLGYVFANGVLLTPACALIIFAGAPLYAIYSDAETWVQALGYCVPGMDAAAFLKQYGGPGTFALMDPVHDQQLGGVIMKLTQETVYGAILFYVFIRWYRRENPSETLDPLEEHDIDLNSGGLNRA
jgi:putative membrane protein